MSRRPPSGEQHRLTAGRHRAVVTAVGATLQEYVVDGRPILDGFGADGRSTFGRGQVLAPWPNRLRDGRYRFSGQDRQLPLDEPERGNAIHGLVRWQEWRATTHTADRVTLEHVIWPRDGYPFLVELSVTYVLDAERGLSVHLVAANAGADPCPFGAGFHPYLAAPGGVDGRAVDGRAVDGRAVDGRAVDAMVVHCPAATVLVTDDRGIPLGRGDVAGTELDFRRPRPVGSARLDTCYTDLVRDGEGRAEIGVLRPGEEEVVTVWMDAAFGFVMLFSADTLPAGQRRSALAVEPMSCAPNALQSGDGLVVLDPGESWTGAWGVGVRPADLSLFSAFPFGSEITESGRSTR